MISVSKLYCGRAGGSDNLRFPEKRGEKPVVVFNCTPRCNLRCVHCYSAAAPAGQELSTTQAKDMLGQLADYGCPVVLFSGGEPLLRPDIFGLLEFAATLKLRTVLSTNGTLIDKNAADRLKNAGVSYVGVSLDGPQALHDRFRGTAGCFAQSIAGLGCCTRAGLAAGLRFTMTVQNIDYVETIFDIAAATAVRRLCFYHLIRAGRAAKSTAPPFEQTRKALDSIISMTERFTAGGLVDEVLTVGNHADGPYLLMKMKSQGHPLCEQAEKLLLRTGGNRVGQNIAAVCWDGSVHPDQFWTGYSLGNVLDTPFAKIWDTAGQPVLEILRNRDKFKDHRCGRCRWFDYCKGNFRCLDTDISLKNWQNEPACYLTNEEIGI